MIVKFCYLQKNGAASYLPSCGAVAVSLVLEVGDVLHHPLVHLTQRQPPLRRALDGLRDQVRVRQVAPRVPPRRTLLVARGVAGGGGAPRGRRGTRGRGSPHRARHLQDRVGGVAWGSTQLNLNMLSKIIFYRVLIVHCRTCMRGLSSCSAHGIACYQSLTQFVCSTECQNGHLKKGTKQKILSKIQLRINRIAPLRTAEGAPGAEEGDWRC